MRKTNLIQNAFSLIDMMKTIAFVGAFCLFASSAQAEGWQYSVSPYLWLPTIKMDSSNANRNGALSRLRDRESLSIGPTNYLQALDFGLMLAGEIRKDDFVVKGDLIYLTFGIEDKDIDLGVPGRGPLAGSYKADLDASIITLAGGKTLARGEQYFVDGLVGWRRLGMAIKLKEGSRGTLFNSDMGLNDAIAAINGEYRFGDGPWSLRYYADVGTGQSDLTWQAVAAVRYALNWGDLILNYRHLEYEVGDVGHFEDLNTTFSGPSLGVNFRF